MENRNGTLTASVDITADANKNGGVVSSQVFFSIPPEGAVPDNQLQNNYSRNAPNWQSYFTWEPLYVGS